MSEDEFTTTLDAAEAFERNRGAGYRDLPDPAEYEFDDWVDPWMTWSDDEKAAWNLAKWGAVA